MRNGILCFVQGCRRVHTGPWETLCPHTPRFSAVPFEPRPWGPSDPPTPRRPLVAPRPWASSAARTPTASAAAPAVSAAATATGAGGPAVGAPPPRRAAGRPPCGPPPRRGGGSPGWRQGGLCFSLRVGMMDTLGWHPPTGLVHPWDPWLLHFLFLKKDFWMLQICQKNHRKLRGASELHGVSTFSKLQHPLQTVFATSVSPQAFPQPTKHCAVTAMALKCIAAELQHTAMQLQFVVPWCRDIRQFTG